MSEPTAGGTGPQPELRLALALRGGVSLAVWMGGACAEIDELRRASDDLTAGDPADREASSFWQDVLALSPYSKVVVDVMAGASAGGLNGVLFTSAIRHGFPMSELLPVWRKVADVEALRRTEPPWRSLFDGDRAFLDVIDRELVRLTGDGEGATANGAVEGSDRYVDLQLTATLVEPISQPAVSPTDEALRRSRAAARFHFRHDPESVFPRQDLERDGLARMAVAARASASFPFAFEAAVVRSSRPATFEVQAPPASARPVPGIEDQAARRLVDCRGVFSESRGPAGPRTAPIDPDDFVVADGGIVDNIPLGRALDAISLTPADRPTRRVLVYLHPSGPPVDDPGAGVATAGEEPADRRGPRALAQGLVASKLQGQSIDEDLEVMEAGNRNLRLRRQMRQALASHSGPGDDFIGTALARRQGYLEQRAAVDAEAVRELLHDPLVVLGEDPFPVAPDGGSDDRWRAPTALWTAEQRLELVSGLRERFLGRLEGRFLDLDDELVSLRRLLTGGLGPLTRSGGLLMELALAVESRRGVDHSRLGSLKADLYRLNSLVRELDRVRQIGWVAAAGNLGSGSVDEWVGRTLADLNRLLRCPRPVALALCNGLDAAAGSTDLGGARRSFVAGCNAGLQRIAQGESPVVDEDDAVDIREVVILAMGFIADEMVALWDASTSTDDVNGASYIRNVLAQRTGAPYDYGARFAALEVLLLREHLLGTSAGVEVSFTRLSAAAPTIDARRYERLYRASADLNPTYTRPDQLLPDVKLAGNELHNFGSFLDERWRYNDWLWGRMDAVPTLVDLLLGMDRAKADRADPTAFAGYLGFDSGDPDLEVVRRELIRRRQDEVFDEVVAAMGSGESGREPLDRAHWDVGLETLTVPGTPARAKAVGDLANVGALVVGSVLPPSVPRVTGALQGVAGAVARRYASPRGWGAAAAARAPGPEPGRAEPARTPLWVHLIAPLIGVLVAGAVWALADSRTSLAVGFVAGVVVALVPGLFTLWLGAFRRPQPARRTRVLLLVLPYAAVAAVSAAVAVALTR